MHFIIIHLFFTNSKTVMSISVYLCLHIVSIIYYSITNHPKTYRFKTTFNIFHDSVSWLDGSSVGISWIHSCGSIQLLEQLRMEPLFPHAYSCSAFAQYRDLYSQEGKTQCTNTYQAVSNTPQGIRDTRSHD